MFQSGDKEPIYHRGTKIICTLRLTIDTKDQSLSFLPMVNNIGAHVKINALSQFIYECARHLHCDS